jgi:hypothetical protein
MMNISFIYLHTKIFTHATPQALREEHAQLLSKSRESQKEARDTKKELHQLRKQVEDLTTQTTIRSMISLRENLKSARVNLHQTRAEFEKFQTEVRECVVNVSNALVGYCAFVLPLGKEEPARIKTVKLSGEQLGAGLKHMIGKYRAALGEARTLNLKVSVLYICRWVRTNRCILPK